MGTYYYDGQCLKNIIDKIDNINYIKKLEFRAVKPEKDDNFRNKYRLIYGKEFIEVTIKVYEKSVIVECASKDDRIHLNGSLGEFFDRCNSLEELDVTCLDTSEVNNMVGMFSECTHIKSLDLSNFDTSKVKNMGCMFCRCINIKTLDLSNFNTDNLSIMGGMFWGCIGIKELDLSNFNTNRVTFMMGMFRDCINLRTLDLSNFNTRNVSRMDGMFECCDSIDIKTSDKRILEEYNRR